MELDLRPQGLRSSKCSKLIFGNIPIVIGTNLIFLFFDYIVDMGGFGHLMDFCNFWTRELHLNSSYGLGILRQPFRTMSCRKFGS